MPGCRCRAAGAGLPGPEVDGEAARFDFACANAGTDYHAVDTCRMVSGAMVVVGPDLTVRGIEGLRVAGSSVVPRVRSCNTNAPTIMIGENASDLIPGCEPLPPAVFEGQRAVGRWGRVDGVRGSSA